MDRNNEQGGIHPTWNGWIEKKIEFRSFYSLHTDKANMRIDEGSMSFIVYGITSKPGQDGVTTGMTSSIFNRMCTQNGWPSVFYTFRT